MPISLASSGDKLERDNLFYLLFTFRFGFVNKQLLLLLLLLLLLVTFCWPFSLTLIYHAFFVCLFVFGSVL